MRRIVVVGGSLAGVNAVEALRERNFDGELTLVSAEPDSPYDRPPLSKEVLLDEHAPERLALRNGSWYEELDVALLLGRRAVGIDSTSSRVVLSDGTQLEYDGLVVATGSIARHLGLPVGGPRVHVLRTLEDALHLRQELVAGRHLLMIGGGFIGLEVAAAARAIGLDVTVVEGAPMPLARVFGAEAGEWYRALHERHGVRVECGRSLSSLEPSGAGARAVLSDGTAVAADVVVAGIGSAPAVDWLAGSGVVVADGVTCDPDLSTSIPNIVAAGDVASWRNPLFDETMRVEHWSNAVDQGRHAAATLLGEREPFESVPYFWTDQHGTKSRFVGRTAGATQRRVERSSDDEIVVTFGRDGVLVGALCVGAPRQLARYGAAIRARTPWEDAAEATLAATG